MPRSIHTRTARAQTARLLAAAALASVALLAGCGGSSSPGVARLPSTRRAAPAGSGGSSPENGAANPQQAMLAYATCMRANGVPSFPDPSAGGFLIHGVDPRTPAFRTAQAKCRKLLPGGGPPGPGARTNPSPQTLARFLGISQCMRKHGVYDFPDPRTSVPSNPFGASGAGIISDIEGVILIFPSTIDQSAPAFTRAAAACAFPLHNH
jgi:hypothetical protein